MASPDRAAVIEGLARLIGDGRPRLDRGGETRAAACVIAVEGHAELDQLDPEGTEAAMEEIVGRLDGLVRTNDALGRIAPDRIVLGVNIAPGVAGVLVDRIAGAAALPIEVAGQVLSLEVTVGIAFDSDDHGLSLRRAEVLLDGAETEVDRLRSRRRSS